jgi:hypothetical protein
MTRKSLRWDISEKAQKKPPEKGAIYETIS